MLSKSIWVIGDCHGCYDTLVALVNKIRAESEDTICFVGDLVDRGPKSRQVVQFVMDGRYKCTTANHEQMMVTDLDKTTEYPGSWEMNGGIQTLKSYEDFPEALERHLIWLKNLPTYLEFKNCKNENGDTLVVSHSCIIDVWEDRNSPHKDEQNYFETTATWGRDLPNTEKGQKLGIFNIFGHTPFPDGPRIAASWANVDTGAVYKRTHYGKLTALQYPSLKVIQQENIDG